MTQKQSIQGCKTESGKNHYSGDPKSTVYQIRTEDSLALFLSYQQNAYADFFFIEIFIKTIVESHAVVKNNTEGSLVNYSFSPNGNILWN